MNVSAIRELDDEEICAVSGAGFFDDLWHGITSVVAVAGDFLGFDGRFGYQGGGAAAHGIEVKPGANLDDIRGEIYTRFGEIEDVFRAHGVAPVITSGNDGVHRSDSLHYQNLAIDMRANNISEAEARQLRDDLQSRLGPDYDVLFEEFPANPSNDHLHIEFDPN